MVQGVCPGIGSEFGEDRAVHSAQEPWCELRDGIRHEGVPAPDDSSPEMARPTGSQSKPGPGARAQQTSQ